MGSLSTLGSCKNGPQLTRSMLMMSLTPFSAVIRMTASKYSARLTPASPSPDPRVYMHVT